MSPQSTVKRRHSLCCQVTDSGMAIKSTLMKHRVPATIRPGQVVGATSPLKQDNRGSVVDLEHRPSMQQLSIN